MYHKILLYSKKASEKDEGFLIFDILAFTIKKIENNTFCEFSKANDNYFGKYFILLN